MPFIVYELSNINFTNIKEKGLRGISLLGVDGINCPFLEPPRNDNLRQIFQQVLFIKPNFLPS